MPDDPVSAATDLFLGLDQSQAWADDVVEMAPEFEYDQTVS